MGTNHRFQTATLLSLERSRDASAQLTGSRAAGQHGSRRAVRSTGGSHGFSPCPETLGHSMPSGFCHSTFYHPCL